jgi:hypothetical protein
MNFFVRWQKCDLGTRVDERSWAGRSAMALPYERRITWGIFFLLLVLIFLRAPTLMLEPRLWAEEASTFLQYAYTHSFLESLTFVPKRTAGYFLFVATLPTTLAAHMFPLAYAPVVTTYFSLGILLTLFALILWGHSYVWNTVGKKTLACLIILFAPSSTGEVWLNSINAQVYCGIIASCLLLEDLRAVSPRRRWGYRLLLGFCGLSGIYATLLGGMFFVKAWMEKSREAIIHVGVLACTSLIQVMVFFHLYFSNNISAKKLAGLNLGKTVPHLFSYQVALPLLGPQWGQRLRSSLYAFFTTWGDTVVTGSALLAGILAVGYLCAVLYGILPRAQLRSQLLLLGSYACTAAGTSVFSAGGVPGGRYAVASGVFLLWMLLNNLRLSTLDLRSMLCAVLLAGALVFGMMGYRTTGAQIFFVCNANCPKWEDELKRCELTSKCVLTVWPYPRWKFPWTVSPAAAAPN